MHFSFGLLLPVLSPVLLGLGVALGNWFHGRIVKPADYQRASILQQIAEGAAALVISTNTNPKATWPDLLKQIVQAIESAAGLPTHNADAIQRAAAAALTKLGKQQA